MTYTATEVDKANDVPAGTGKTWRIMNNSPLQVIGVDFDSGHTAWLVTRELNQAVSLGREQKTREFAAAVNVIRELLT